MKKLCKLSLALALLSTVSSMAFAEGTAFTPLNFDDATPVVTAAPKKAVATVATATKATAEKATETKASNPISSAISKVMPSKNDPTATTASGETPIGNDNIQNAILELDNAQVGIRNDLVTYKAKYADIDAQYKLIKNERNMLNKQIVSIERRIKSIDKAKDKIRRNML